MALIHAIEKSTQYQASKRLENGVQSKSSESSEIESSHFFRGQSEFGTGQTQSVTKPEAESVESTQELRKRAREERKEKTLEQIKRIKDHSKEVDRAHLRTVIVKYSGVLLAASFLIGAGVFITRIS